VSPGDDDGRSTEGSSIARFANAASRAVRKFEGCWDANDWEGVIATFAPTHVMDDRRALVRLHLEGKDYFASLRMVFDTTASRWQLQLLATRGERLALFRVKLEAMSAASRWPMTCSGSLRSVNGASAPHSWRSTSMISMPPMPSSTNATRRARLHRMLN